MQISLSRSLTNVKIEDVFRLIIKIKEKEKYINIDYELINWVEIIKNE